MPDQPFRVVVLDDYERLADTVPAYRELQGRADVVILHDPIDHGAPWPVALQRANALLLMRERTQLDARALERLQDLRFIAQTGRTFSHIDLEAAARRGVAICGTPAENNPATIELAVGLILALLRRIPEVDRRMREERWPALTGRTLGGSVVGILGLGRIGSRVAGLVRAFGARVLAWSPSLTPERARAAGAECVTFDTLLREADVLTIHARLSAGTRGLIGPRELAVMKPGALLVNTARGPIVSEAAMIAALDSGHLGGVALDVYDEEPLPLDHPLRRCDRAILLSHRGYTTIDVLTARYQQAMEHILAFMDGRPLPLLNPGALRAT